MQWNPQNDRSINIYLDIYYSLKHEVSQNGNLLPFHRNDLQGHKQWGCNLHTRSPEKMNEITPEIQMHSLQQGHIFILPQMWFFVITQERQESLHCIARNMNAQKSWVNCQARDVENFACSQEK